MHTNRLIGLPTTEPVTLDEFKSYARIDDSTDDALCAVLIASARQWCEHFTCRAFMTQNWRLTLSEPPTARYVELPRAPLASLLNVTTYDDAGNGTVWGASNYYSDQESEPGRLVLREGSAWPEFIRAADAVSIDYVAGYGDSSDDVPATLKLAVKQLALHWYEFRGEALAQSGVTMAPLTVEALLQPFRIIRAGGL